MAPMANPSVLTIRAVPVDAPLATLLGTSGCSTMVNITAAITATTKLHAAVAAEPTTQLAMRLDEATTNKVAINVAEKPPKNALRKASCREISAR